MLQRETVSQSSLGGSKGRRVRHRAAHVRRREDLGPLGRSRVIGHRQGEAGRRGGLAVRRFSHLVLGPAALLPIDPPSRPGRPVSRPRPHYSFGDGGNGWRLRRYFNSDMGRINRARRHRFLAGGYFPRQYVTYIQPIPPDIMGYLPAAPPGYALGYYDGYAVAYDPATYLIASVLDLFNY